MRREASRTALDTKFAKTVNSRFAILRTQILREMRKHGWRRLAITPLTAGAGGTSVAVQLALALSRQKLTEVILVDLDLAQPSIATTLGIPGCDPVSEVLNLNRPMADITAIVEEVPNLWVVAPGSAEDDAAELLQDDALATALHVWRGIRPNAIEIFDTAALLDGDAALATLPLVDAILLVADGRRSTNSDMTKAERLLKDLPPIMGVILNKSED
ncbi:chromosome partitioning protein [Paracoccus aestuariivivens]|uniref:Chromosome partitioning protein n=1 Tax=Paracoccus aestuariivivens TaxID=1820333 RepID=A0A6L6J9J9_9RHOB|nr:chromosome partitioning protein [Paracoccus aestuariivivens]